MEREDDGRYGASAPSGSQGCAPEPAAQSPPSVSIPIAQYRPAGALLLADMISQHGAGNFLFFRASKKHCRELEWFIFTGQVGVDKMGADNWEYEYFVIREPRYIEPHKRSLKDANLIPNSYNDWFVFGTIDAAQTYLAQGMEAGTGETGIAGLDAKRDSPVGAADAPEGA